MTELEALVSAGLAKASERYTSFALLRAGVAAIPLVGSAIDAVLTTWGADVQAMRIQALIDALEEEIDRLNEQTVSKEYLTSVEWGDGVLKAFEATARTSDEERIRIYARILLGAGTEAVPDVPPPASLIATLSELTPSEVHLARLFAEMPGSIRYDDLKQARRVVTPDAWASLVEKCPAALRPNFLFHLKRLERSGLISEITGTYGGGGMYEPTPTLWRILGYLRESGPRAKTADEGAA